MKIIYLTNARLPTEKAHGLAAVKLCEAFANQGLKVMIIAPRRVNPLKADVYDYYNARRNFEIRFLPTVDFLWLGFGQRFFFLIQLFSFALVAVVWLWKYCGRRELREAVLFSHDHVPLFFASFFAANVFYDIHDYPQDNVFYRRVLSRAVGVAVQTKWKVKKLQDDFGLPESKIVYWPNGVDIQRFAVDVTAREARQKLNLPQDKKIVLYAGSLQSWKGVETLVAAGQFLPEGGFIYIVGGMKSEGEQFKIQNSKFKIRNVAFVGQRPWREMPLWLKAADVLVLPNTGKHEISLYYTSPMKLFEYMASERPIVASDIPSIREVVDETMVFFAAADDPVSLAGAITAVLRDPEAAARRAVRSRDKVKQYTWAARADKIIAVLKEAVAD